MTRSIANIFDLELPPRGKPLAPPTADRPRRGIKATRPLGLRASISILALCLFGYGCRQRSSETEIADSSRFVIGLSPYLADETKDELFRLIVAFTLEEAPLGSSVWLYDAFDNATITRIDIPTTSAFASSKTRASQFKHQINDLRAFLAASHATPEGDNLDFAQAVRFPQFSRFLSENLRHSSEETRVLLIGSPLYLDGRESAFSMIDGYFPTDAHLTAPRDHSVYSTMGREESLEGVTTHLAWFGDPWESEIHKEKVRRFWSLYLHLQGGNLASFTGDLATAFDSLKDNAVPKSEYEIDPSQQKIEMARISRNVGLADWITGDLSGTSPQPAPTTFVGPMKIGIRWNDAIDLDLYARPNAESQTLSFQRARSDSGLYYKDHRSSTDRDYEFIEFSTPVDLRKAEAWVNFFDGSIGTPARGEARIEFDGRIYAKPFSIAAKQGNHGRGGDSQSAFWSRIDILGILNLSALESPDEQHPEQ